VTAITGSWKKLLIVLAAGLALLFASRQSGKGQAAAAAERPAPAAAGAVPQDAPPPSNEIRDFQQLD
jgi:hypothetical protein